MLCRQRPDLSDLSIRTQEGILVKKFKRTFQLKNLIAGKSNLSWFFNYPVVAIVVSRTKIS